MIYPLDKLEQLITIPGKQGADVVLSEREIAGILQEALQEIERIQAAILPQFFQFSKTKELETYIKNYQSALTLLLDKLYQQQQNLPEEASQETFYDSLYKGILGILSFIETYFGSYFDKQKKVPAIYVVLTRKAIHDGWKLIEAKVVALINDPAISLIVQKQFEQFSEQPAESYTTYRDVMYQRSLLSELNDLENWNREQFPFNGIVQLLIYLNFNDKRFINYLVNGLTQSVNDLGDLNEKMDWLLGYSKNLHQLQRKPDVVFRVKHPSVVEQLGNWITEEMYYLERKLGLFAANALEKPLANNSAAIKVTVNSSVDQLAIFFRAAVDIQLIAASSQKSLFEKITPHIATVHARTLSPGSMRSKSYSAEQRDIEQVKDVLMQLYKKVTQY